MSHVIQTTYSSKIFTGRWYLQFCLLLYASRTLCYSTLQSLKGTQKEKYSINTLYDETIDLYGDLYHLGNLNRHLRASCSRHLYTGFRGGINLCINLHFII